MSNSKAILYSVFTGSVVSVSVCVHTHTLGSAGHGGGGAVLLLTEELHSVGREPPSHSLSSSGLQLTLPPSIACSFGHLHTHSMGKW